MRELFVFEIETGWLVRIPKLWEESGEIKFVEKIFSKSKYRYPKLKAERFRDNFISFYYGQPRGSYMSVTPRYSQRLRWGCGVSVYETERTARGVKYPIVVVSWTELDPKNGSRRRQRHKHIDVNNRLEALHEASLFAASKRAELTHSVLHESALNFEYDIHMRE